MDGGGVGPARVLLVGFEDQDNLGLRYLAARLAEAGHHPRLATFRDDAAGLLAEARAFDPHVVGLSLIFQFMAPRFGRVVAALREGGLGAHLTIGGHYASFAPERVLVGLPGLDSVVRYEGEDTLVALAEAVVAGADVAGLPGVATLDPATGALRPFTGRVARIDLDTLPWPLREPPSGPLPTASMLGSRGCPWACSFCSIITFYEQNGTQGRRRRDPVRVVDEVEDLVDRGARVLLWQDDDFLAGGHRATAWAHAVAGELLRRGLDRRMRWKMSCRSDEVRAPVLAPLVAAGLTHVYLGVEAGDADDLRHLHKKLEPAVHLRAGAVLRDAGLSFDFGFMLLNPWSTVGSVRSNLAFLRAFTGDGAAAAGFCRMLPYAGTPAAERLAAEGRLIEHGFDVDYRFLDPRLDLLYDWTLHGLGDRNHGAGGTWSLLRLLLFEAALDHPERPRRPALLRAARALAAVANELVVTATEQALEVVEDGATGLDDPELVAIAEAHREEDARVRREARALLVEVEGGRHAFR